MGLGWDHELWDNELEHVLGQAVATASAPAQQAADRPAPPPAAAVEPAGLVRGVGARAAFFNSRSRALLEEVVVLLNLDV